jgi:hypothetical protein
VAAGLDPNINSFGLINDWAAFLFASEVAATSLALLRKKIVMITGRSRVTGSTLSFFVGADRIWDLTAVRRAAIRLADTSLRARS